MWKMLSWTVNSFFLIEIHNVEIVKAVALFHSKRMLNGSNKPQSKYRIIFIVCINTKCYFVSKNSVLHLKLSNAAD